MAKVLVLNVNNNIITPALDLIRKISNPNSTSRPHITIRYVDKLPESNLKIYKEVQPEYIDLIAPGSFGILDEGESDDLSRKTVFIKCSSDILEVIAHKPHYPDSVFHITLYDGKSKNYATELLKKLNKYAWNIRVDLLGENRIDEISLGRKKSGSKSGDEIYLDDTKTLYSNLVGYSLEKNHIENLSDNEKLEIIEKVCEYIFSQSEGFTRSIDYMVSPFGLAEPALEDLSSWSKKSSVENNKAGLYLTPPELATEITKKVLELVRLRNIEIDFGDPAIGTGVFFSILQHLLPEDQIKSAIGIELNSSRAKATERRWGHKGLKVFTGDYLHIDNLPHRSLIIANPPYVRYQNIDPKYSKALREKAIIESGTKISGLSGLYVYFILASHAWLQENALSAWLVPSDFMSSNYGSTLRDYLLNKVDIDFIHIYSDESPQFENAQVSPCVLIFTNRLPSPEKVIKFTYGGSIDDPKVIKHHAVESLKSLRKWSFGQLFEPLRVFEGPLLGELFSINRGIATGANEFFLMKDSELDKFKIPRSLTKPVIPKVRYLKSDIIAALPNGDPDVNPKLFLFDTSIDEKDLRILYPELAQYLNLGEKLGVKERALVKSRKIWTQQEKRKPAPFLATYMGRGSKENSPIRFLLNQSKGVATNNYLLMYPNLRLSELLERKPELIDSLFHILKELETEVLKLHWRKYGGGLKKIEPKDLMRVRLQKCPKWLESVVEFKLEL